MKIRRVRANNHRKAFEVETEDGRHVFPYARLRLRPTPQNRVAKVFSDAELGHEALTYVLEDGEQDSIHVDEVLEYNEDPAYLGDLLLYRLTLEARKAVAESDLSKREIIRRLGTSASQFYRLLDPTNYGKSVGQLVALLHIVGCEVDLVVRGGAESANVKREA
ncbi:MAG: hypothetical protein P8099_16810 [Gemmatimonadota bacterium]